MIQSQDATNHTGFSPVHTYHTQDKMKVKTSEQNNHQRDKIKKFPLTFYLILLLVAAWYSDHHAPSVTMQNNSGEKEQTCICFNGILEQSETVVWLFNKLKLQTHVTNNVLTIRGSHSYGEVLVRQARSSMC